MEIKLERGDIVSIVGTGGKTTLLKRLVSQLPLKEKVVIAASTKFIPPEIPNKTIFKSTNSSELIKNIGNYNVFVFAEKIIDNKYSGITEENIEKFKNIFEYILIEADGSRHLPYKGWSSWEPVVPRSTTKTIGVFPLLLYNNKLPEDKVFNYDIFIRDFEDDFLNKEMVLKIVTHDNGLFKNAKGNKVLYFTQWYHLEYKKVLNLAKYIEEKTGIEVILGTRWKE